MILNDSSPMPFGKHKNKKMEDVPASYLIWLYDNNKCTDEVRAYVEDNLDVLNHQIQEENDE